MIHFAQKILSVAQIRQADTYTIQHEPLTSDDLMERASAAFVRWFVGHFAAPQSVCIVCGTGNNGGDGLCVARLLFLRGYSVQVILADIGTPTPDFLLNIKRLKRLDAILVTPISHENHLQHVAAIAKGAVLIDALFGSGLTRPLSGFTAHIVEWINQQGKHALIVAIDMPSGLYADRKPDGLVVQAAHTVSFELPKLAFMLPQSHPFVGQWHCVSIGLHPAFIDTAKTPYYYITQSLVTQITQTPGKFAHKGSRGHVLVIGGSFGKIGACVLTATAVLSNGAGLATVYVPRCGYTTLQTAIPEAMVLCDAGDTHLTQTPPETEKYQVLAVGMGMGQADASANVLWTLLKTSCVPMVIDADALNIIARHGWQAHIPRNSILTPHPKEFERIAGNSVDEFERLEKLRLFAQKHNCYVALKGAHTALACPDGKVFFNSTGNPGMATAGSGDVLTGFIAAYFAQGYSLFHAALLGIYRHGQTGDRQVAMSNNGNIRAGQLANDARL